MDLLHALYILTNHSLVGQFEVLSVSSGMASRRMPGRHVVDDFANMLTRRLA